MQRRPTVLGFFEEKKMKFFQEIALTALTLSTLATAGIVRPEVALTLSDISVDKVAHKGTVLRRNHMFPVESILVGIPATLTTKSACVQFAGQETKREGDLTIIAAKGASDPMLEACIAVMPAPIETVLTLSFGVNNERVYPSIDCITKHVVIGNRSYIVRLNPAQEEVTIIPSREPLTSSEPASSTPRS